MTPANYEGMSRAPTPPTAYPMSALVVDDVPEIGFAIAHFMSHMCGGGARVAKSASEAIAMLECAPVDILISDLRMPERDGVSLLTEVQSRWPSTLRILFTGQSHWEAALHSISYCHQLLSKPAELQHLGALVNRVAPWFDGTLDPVLADCLGGLSILPSAAANVEALQHLLEQRSPRSADLAAVIRRDPAMSLRVLQIANASFFGGGSRVSDVDGAVSLVGAQCLQDLHRRHALCTPWSATQRPHFDIERMTRHAVVVAQTAKATIRDPRAAETAYTAGLLHSIGHLILQLASPAGMESPTVPSRGMPERLAGQLLAYWGLPSQIIKAIATSHEPPAEDTFGLASAVYLSRKIGDVVQTEAMGPVHPDLPLSDTFVIRHQLEEALPKLVDKAAQAELQTRRTISPVPAMMAAM